MHISIQVWEMREIEYLEQNNKMDFLENTLIKIIRVFFVYFD